MAKASSSAHSRGFLSGLLGITSKRWSAKNISPANEITQEDSWLYGAGSTSVSALLKAGNKTAMARQSVYEIWQEMEADAICSTAMMLLTTAALGRHENTGQSVYIEKKPEIAGNKKLEALVDSISSELTPQFNKVAFTAGYIGANFGDAYARIYSDSRGVTDIYTGELVRPMLVQPFERGSKTVGYAIYVGDRNFERLNVSQMARMQMPRTQWVPQMGVVEKSMKLNLTMDDVDNLPLMPAMAGGSLLYNAEVSYNNLNNSIRGLVAQRWKATLNHNIVGVQMDGMTKAQQKLFYTSVEDMYRAVKKVVDDAIKNNQPIADSITSILPMFGDKQLVSLSQGVTSTQTITIDDVMFHAKMLSGALGVDLSMLGFAEMLSGGLGDGGAFRVSSQMAERASIIRVALGDFFNQIVDIHTLKKYGVVFPEGERPWKINFYGSISALEAEHQRTKTDSMNAGLIIAQTIQLMKDMGVTKDILKVYLSTQMMLDEQYAETLSNIVMTPSPAQQGGME